MAFQRSFLLHTDAAGTAPPDAFGPFRVLHQVGAGTLGPVYRAYDADRDRLVAVKLFKLDLPPERLHQLVAEFERLIAAAWSHPAVAAPIATGTDGIVVYLVRDFVSAESLDVVVRDHGRSAPEEALRVAAQVAGALDCSAASNAYHGALHPRDVLISNDEIRLTDIGVGPAIEKLGVPLAVRRPYTAPERIAGDPWDRRADIFGLAALVYEMLWGRRLTAIGTEVGGTLTDLPGGDLGALKATFARALAEQPAERFEAALDFAEALKRAFSASRQSRLVGRESGQRGRPTINDHRLTTNDHRLTTNEPHLLLEGFDDLSLASASVTSDRRLPTDDYRLPTPRAEVEPDLPLSSAIGDARDELALSPTEATAERGADFQVGAETPAAAARVVSASALDTLQPDEAPLQRAALTPRETGQLEMSDVATGSSRSFGGWLAAVLVVGLALGFGAGYLVAGRQRPAAPAAADRPGSPVDAKDQVGGASETGRLPPPRVALRRATPERSEGGKPATTTAGAAETVRLKPDTTSEDAAGSVRPTPGATGGGAPTGAASSMGQLVVRSRPAGARVFVDGREQGRTPASVRGLEPGAHRVRVVHDGYVTQDRRVIITGSRSTHSLTLELERPRTAGPSKPATLSGELRVESKPARARVFIDGKLVGTTPMAVGQVRFGEHAIRLELDGYRDWSSSVRVVEGERNRVTASLER